MVPGLSLAFTRHFDGSSEPFLFTGVALFVAHNADAPRLRGPGALKHGHECKV